MGFSFEELTFFSLAKGGLCKMKYCPYCGTVLVDGAVSFCAECGKALPVSEKKEEISEKSNLSEQQGKPKPQQETWHEKKSRRTQKRKLLHGVKEREVDKTSERQIKPSEPPKRPKQQIGRAHV